MEKLQLCLDEDDYDFPTGTANINLGAGSSPIQSQNDRTAESAVISNPTASACELHLPPLSHDHSMLYNHSCSKPNIKSVSESAANVEVPWNPEHSGGKNAVNWEGPSSSLQNPTKFTIQDVLKAKSSPVQDVFWASVLQAQLCVLELQDELEKQEVTAEISHSEPSTTRLYLDSSVAVPYQHGEDDVVLDESPDNEETFSSDGEIEEAHLFCDNPLFNAVHSSYPADADSPPTYALRTNTKDFIPFNKGSDHREVVPHDHPTQDKLKLWDQKVECHETCFGHEMISHTESLEILQIFETDLEEREAIAGRLKAPKWPVYDNLPFTKESPHRPQDGTCSSALQTPEIAVLEKDDSEAEGLLFHHSSSSLVTALLVEQDSLQPDCPFPTSTDEPTCPIIHIESQEGEGTGQEDADSHALCTECQGKEHSIRRVSEEEAEVVTSSPQQSVTKPVKEEADKKSTFSSEEGTYVETVPNINNENREAARCLATRLFQLDGIERSQVASYLQKTDDFSAMVAEEYLSHFDFTGNTLDVSLRCLLKELILTGETQERERVLIQFSNRFHGCNPECFKSADAVHTLTCALMLLNSDLHGQNIGKSMNLRDFIINLQGMNDGDSFPRDLLKGLYHSIRNEKLEWAVSEEKLTNSLGKPENIMNRKKSNPFIDVACPDPEAPVYRKGMLCRKVHADSDGKRTPWGKRGWKSFNTVLKGMVMLLLKDEYRSDIQCPEEIISVHHALAEAANEYTKKPHVFRLQTADWRVFLFQAQTLEEMNSWIVRINLVAAMFSSPPFPAAIGSQKRFVRPILPSGPCKLALEEQLQSHEMWMDTFTDDLTEHQRNLPDAKSKARDWEDYHLKEEYLRFEKSRYEMYVKLLALRMQKGCDDLHTFESLVIGPDVVQQDGCGLKRSYSSPSLIPESFPVVIKVKRNISERRTYRRIIPKRNKNEMCHNMSLLAS